MPLLDILTLIGFGFGTALAVMLFSLSLQRRPKRPVDAAFAILFLSIIFWFAGNFFAILISLLFGRVVAVEIRALSVIAYLGLSLTPSALVHIQLIHLLTLEQESTRLRRRHITLMAFLYLPAFAFIALYGDYVIRHVEPYPGRSTWISTPFLIWLLFCLLVSIIASERLTRILREESDRRFYRSISNVLLFIGIGVTLIYLFSFRRLPFIGPYLDLLMLLSPAFPLAVLLYYVYRYNFYRLVIKPSFVHSIAYGLLMAAYLLGIRRIGEYLRQFPEVNAEIIEGLLLVALVFAFQPFRAAFQSRLDKLFFRDRYYYQLFLRELSDSISSLVDLEELTQKLKSSLQSALKVRRCAVLIFRPDSPEPEPVKGGDKSPLIDDKMLVEALLATRGFSLRRQMRDPRVQAALRGSDVALAVPIFFRNELRGVICLGAKENGNDFSEEELDVLQTFANQIGLAVENARLVQERLELIDRIHQAEKLSSLGQLAATLSHELKNPLSSIKAIIQVMHESAGEAEKADLALVLEEIERLQRILQRLLTFARPPAAEVETVRPDQVVRDVLTLLGHQARRSGIELIDSLRPMPPVTLNVHALREIVFNLVLNAMQAVQAEGRVEVTLSAHTKRRGGRKHSTLVLTVADDGPGVPDSVRKRIFEPFFTTKTVGAGLGLAIVKRTLEEMGGQILVDNRPGGGALFTIILPINAA
ncbi:MAG: ATP-binding protein [candidate division KSB1 bacterium]|nr:ATP-binding protein [candidate division KSB1 bacterium]